MKRWKVALSLAIVAAVASPFALHTYKMRYPRWRVWKPLDAVDRQQLNANPANCAANPDLSVCEFAKRSLEEGGYYVPTDSLALYLLLNLAVAMASFAIVYGLTFLIPNLIRRYWKWIST